MSETIKALLIDPDAHGRGADGVQPVELPADSDTRIEEINRLLGSRSFEGASSLLRGTARNASLFVDANPIDGGTHWCWTWGLSEPVVGKGLILGVDKEGNSIDTPISERQAWERVRFAPRLLKGAESYTVKDKDGDLIGFGTRRIAPIVDKDGNELLIQQTFMSGKPLIPNHLAEKLFANWREAVAKGGAPEFPHFPDKPPVVKLFMVGGWDAYIQAVDPAEPRRAYGIWSAWPPSTGKVALGINDLDEVAQYRLGILPVERDLYVDLDQPLSHYAKELAAA